MYCTLFFCLFVCLSILCDKLLLLVVVVVIYSDEYVLEKLS